MRGPAEESSWGFARAIRPFANSLSRRGLKLPHRTPGACGPDGRGLPAASGSTPVPPSLLRSTTEGEPIASDTIPHSTEQKMAQDALERAEARFRQLADRFAESNRRRDQFLAILSHELRNPLAPILAAVQVLRQDRSDSPANRQARNVIERQVRQLAHLVDDLLDTSRFAAGKLQLRKEPIELQVVLERALESARPHCEARSHRVTVAVPAEPIWLHADPARLEQVFVNLLNNAAKYTRDRGCIAVTAERQGSEAVVTIEDSGIGIPQHLLNDIFEIFTQIHPAGAASQVGLGVGLALVKTLVELHGGSVTAESEGAERGSRFSVRLPSSMAAAPAVSPGGPRVIPPRGGLRVLVADDDQDAAQMLSLVLSTLGHQVRKTHDGQQAVALAAEFAPDVVLMDLWMPTLEGCEVARRIREQPWGRTTVLVALTGWGQEEDKKRSAAAGFNHHLLKPIGIGELQTLLATVPRCSDG